MCNSGVLIMYTYRITHYTTYLIKEKNLNGKCPKKKLKMCPNAYDMHNVHVHVPVLVLCVVMFRKFRFSHVFDACFWTVYCNVLKYYRLSACFSYILEIWAMFEKSVTHWMEKVTNLGHDTILINIWSCLSWLNYRLLSNWCVLFIFNFIALINYKLFFFDKLLLFLSSAAQYFNFFLTWGVLLFWSTSLIAKRKRGKE